MLSANFRRDHYPFVGRFLDRDGIGMHYLDEGQGDALVLLHGNPTWSFYYRKLVLGLRGKCRLIVPDHIGCGLSDKPDDARYSHTLQKRVEDLDALIAHAKLPEKITLVMHDWGGMIGMAWAVRNPHRIGRLVLLNTAAFHLPPTKKLPPSLWLCRKTALDTLLIRKTGLFVRLVTRWGVRSRSLLPVERDAYLAPGSANAIRLAQLRFVQDIPLSEEHPAYALVSDVQSRLTQFQKTPTLICWGDQDWVFDQHFLDEWKRLLPQAEVHQFPDAGHLVLEDKPQEIQTLMQKFFARHPVKE